jgi:alpha-1,6-mannosyltransferase
MPQPTIRITSQEFSYDEYFARSRIPTFLLAILLIASEALYVLLLRLDAINGIRPVAIFLAALGANFVFCFAAYRILRNGPTGHLAWALTLGGAILFRVTLLPAGLPPDLSVSEKLAAMAADRHGDAVSYERFQLFDNDVWRYLWDGHVSSTGRNPYASAPADPSMDEVANEAWETIRDNLTYPNIRTIYPPLAQIVFRAAHRLAPGSVLAMKVIVVCFDLLAYGFVILTLRARNDLPAKSILYGWNPLVIKVFAGSGHIDAVLVAALAGTCYFLARKRPAAASVSLGLAIAAKLAPLVLLPFLARRVGTWRAVLVVLICIACFLPYLGAGTHLFDGLLAFSGKWQFNSGPFRLLASLMPDLLARITCGMLIAMAIFLLYRRDSADPDTFCGVATLALGAVLIFSPVVTPWYVIWLLPLGVLAWNRVAIVFSVSVCTAFLVMVRGVEWPWALILEYGSLAAIMAWSFTFAPARKGQL